MAAESGSAGWHPGRKCLHYKLVCAHDVQPLQSLWDSEREASFALSLV